MAVLTDAILNTLGGQLPLILPTIAVLLAVFLAQIFLKQNALASVPVAFQELAGDEKRRQVYISRARDVYLDGYKKFKNKVFRIITTNKLNVIVVPPKYLNEIKQLPDDTVSFDDAVEQFMHAKYTRLEIGHKLIPHVIKSNLTPALVRLNPIIVEEVLESFHRELPECSDWTSVNINYKLLRIIAMVSGRIFIGTELSRSEEYINMAINYTLELMAARQAVDGMKPWMRPFLAERLPEVGKLDRRLRQADNLIRPVVAERRQRTENKPDDLLQWLLDGQAKFGSCTTESLARMQLGLSFAAIHTTTLTSTNVFYNLAAYPQCLPILREEIRNVLAEHNNQYSSLALQSMKRLDSFIKETMRFESPGASMQRKVNKPFTLSNGQVIPAGVIIEIPAHAISRDTEVFDDPTEFKPWRFYEMRQKAREAGEVEQAAQHQFVSVSPTVLTFGYGRHACPGRFFAASEIKIIVANMLLMYDIKLPEGQEGRYPNLEFGISSVPDPTKELLFKRT